MDKYNEGKHCPKCRGWATTTHRIAYIDTLRRTCQRCRYWWDEQPLDAEEET